jgi:hypothetical protein
MLASAEGETSSLKIRARTVLLEVFLQIIHPN